MALVTAEQLRERLGWPDIREEPWPEYSMRWFRAVPRDESLPSVDFLFDDQVTFLQQVGTGEWHCHPDDIEYAIELARKLIHHEKCVLEERDKNGEYSGSGVVAPNEVLDTLRIDADHFIRRFFGVPPVREAIDYSRYIKGKHLYVERERRAEMDAIYKSVGLPLPEV
jgi:hypothetical protein